MCALQDFNGGNYPYPGMVTASLCTSNCTDKWIALLPNMTYQVVISNVDAVVAWLTYSLTTYAAGSEGVIFAHSESCPGNKCCLSRQSGRWVSINRNLTCL